MFLLLVGDVLDQLATLESASVDSCVTSPPYWHKRDYGHPGQLGQEPTPDEFVEKMVRVFKEVKRVLTPTGTLWINIDDTYLDGQLLGIPWWLVFRLQAEGFILRSDIVWAKPSCTPEPVKNRPTHSYEHLFFFVFGKRYVYNYSDVLEPHTNVWALDCIKKAQEAGTERPKDIDFFNKAARIKSGRSGMTRAQFGSLMNPDGKNRRDVWTMNVHRQKGLRHLAPYPEELVELCIRAGSPKEGIILDPFAGSGTTGAVALRLGRFFVGIELVPESAEIARARLDSLYKLSKEGVDTP